MTWIVLQRCFKQFFKQNFVNTFLQILIEIVFTSKQINYLNAKTFGTILRTLKTQIHPKSMFFLLNWESYEQYKMKGLILLYFTINWTNKYLFKFDSEPFQIVYFVLNFVNSDWLTKSKDSKLSS